MTCEGQTATPQQITDDSLQQQQQQQQQPPSQTDQTSSDTTTPPSSAPTDTPTTSTTTTTSPSGPNTITILEGGTEVDPPSPTVTKGETIEVINKHGQLEVQLQVEVRVILMANLIPV